MRDMQSFLESYMTTTHTLREIVLALMDKGLTEDEAEAEMKKFIKTHRQMGTDEHLQYED